MPCTYTATTTTCSRRAKILFFLYSKTFIKYFRFVYRFSIICLEYLCCNKKKPNNNNNYKFLNVCPYFQAVLLSNMLPMSHLLSYKIYQKIKCLLLLLRLLLLLPRIVVINVLHDLTRHSAPL